SYGITLHIYSYSNSHSPVHLSTISSVFFFNDPATTAIYTLSLHDALPIYVRRFAVTAVAVGVFQHDDLVGAPGTLRRRFRHPKGDRKSTRLNSSHVAISYAVFCLKKKNKQRRTVPSAPSADVCLPPRQSST